jgi:excinuclease ABC subunit A
MSCAEAVKLFHNIPKIRRILQTLCDVGLDYLTLGQSAPTLSGGEAQRVKLSAELARPDTGRTMYLLDEPTTGLHFDDLQKLLDVIQRLIDIGNTVVLIEHNLDMIKAADWVIDLGPEAGTGGGQIVVQGTPEMVVEYAVQAREAASKTGKSKPGMPRSWTGEALTPVLASDPYVERKVYDPSKDDRWKKGDMDIEDIGANAKMPWEADGRQWHTKDRVGRVGEPVNWNGEVLSKVVDYIQQHEGFGETNWNERTVVEITGTKKTQGWFFHAITGDAWFLKMKFRVRPRTFKREELVEQIPLLRPNDMEDVPVYGNTPRVKLTNTKASWQEIEVKVHTLEEIDIPGFWSFLDDAIASFQDKMERKETKIEDESPWAKLGEKWHFMRKGFTPGKKVKWEPEVLEILHEVIQKAAPDGQFLWSNKQVVHVYLPQQKEPWASIQTKKPDGVWLQLAGPKDSVTVGRVADLADAPTVTSQENLDLVRMSFQEVDQVSNKELEEFLSEHAKSVPARISTT